jgi:pimeloyl-ACP methyl ester carboxylesterase
MSTIQRQGARVFYEVRGQGPALILGHSLLLDNTMWDEVVEALARRHRVIAVEARGHGRSTADGPMSLWDLADDWRAILDQEEVDRAFVCGLSMGGMTGMRLALRAPDRVAGLALLDTSADPEPRRSRFEYRVLSEIVRRFGFRRAFLPTARKAFLGRTTRRGRPDLVARLDERLLAVSPMTYFGSRAVFDRESILDQLGAIRCPTLVLTGEEDAATPPARARRIADAIAGARLVTIPGAGHLTPMEAPLAVTRELEQFLEEARGEVAAQR